MVLSPQSAWDRTAGSHTCLLKPVTVFLDTNQKVSKLEVISSLADIKCCLMTHRAKSIIPTQTCNCPFFSPGKVYRTPPCSLSYHQAVVSDQPGVPGTLVPLVIMTEKPICAALPSLPHTRGTLSQLKILSECNANKKQTCSEHRVVWHRALPLRCEQSELACSSQDAPELFLHEGIFSAAV